MRLLVTGDRNWTQVKYLWETLDRIHRTDPIEAIIEGCAPGADNASEAWGAKNEVPVEHYPARWKVHGGQLAIHPPEWADIIELCRCQPGADHCSFAGYRRNEEMIFDARPDRVAAFHGSIQLSRGTRHMALVASVLGVPVTVYPRGNDTHVTSTIQLARVCAAPIPCRRKGCHRAQAHRFVMYRYGPELWRPTGLAWCAEHVPAGVMRG